METSRKKIFLVDDNPTNLTIDRTQQYLQILTDALIEKKLYPEYEHILRDKFFVQSAQLHDVGKIAIADNILKKPAKLTDDEYENMKTHTVDILAGGRGTHFDPDLIEIFISVAGDFKKTMVMVQANKQKDIDEQQAS